MAKVPALARVELKLRPIGRKQTPKTAQLCLPLPTHQKMPHRAGPTLFKSPTISTNC
jgi:hypothetical protein